MKKAGISSIAYYISAHGYGHGVRSCNIIQAINRLYPNLTVYVVSELPESFLSSQIDLSRCILRAESFDVGMVQKDSICVDVPATLRKVNSLYAGRKERVARERTFLTGKKIGLIVVDIPAIPIEAAAECGIPRIAVGNFAWDWIYAEFIDQNPAWQTIVDVLHEEYARTDLLLRLPFCEKMRAFPRIEDIPLVASPGTSCRGDIARITESDPAKKWILLSFTSLDWNERALKRVERIREYEFFTVRPLEWHAKNIHTLHRGPRSFADILASMDAVISKPGFGILSDCIANHKPLIYADRSNFSEYAILVDAIQRYVRHAHIPAAELYKGNLEESIALVWKSPEPAEQMALGGGEIAAGRIAGFLERP